METAACHTPARTMAALLTHGCTRPERACALQWQAQTGGEYTVQQHSNLASAGLHDRAEAATGLGSALLQRLHVDLALLALSVRGRRARSAPRAPGRLLPPLALAPRLARRLAPPLGLAPAARVAVAPALAPRVGAARLAPQVALALAAVVALARAPRVGRALTLRHVAVVVRRRRRGGAATARRERAAVQGRLAARRALAGALVRGHRRRPRLRLRVGHVRVLLGALLGGAHGGLGLGQGARLCIALRRRRRYAGLVGTVALVARVGGRRLRAGAGLPVVGIWRACARAVLFSAGTRCRCSRCQVTRTTSHLTSHSRTSHLPRRMWRAACQSMPRTV